METNTIKRQRVKAKGSFQERKKGGNEKRLLCDSLFLLFAFMLFLIVGGMLTLLLLFLLFPAVQIVPNLRLRYMGSSLFVLPIGSAS